jgi:DHA2 family multidrug resistance protein
LVAGLLVLSAASMSGFLKRTLRASHPLVDLSTFASRNFAVGCLLSFVLGMGLFGSVYLMPVFLAFVRGHNALQIGMIMLVTGVAQLCVAPVAVALEQRLDARLLSAAGFALFATGLAMSAAQTPQTDYDAMFWPQVVRGVGIMFCLLPPTRLALGGLSLERVPDASGLFNLMRNLGGAIGLALIDTVIYSRTANHASEMTQKLTAGDVPTARFVGIPLDMFAAQKAGPLDALSQSMLAPMLEKAALTLAINEAWLMLAAVTAAVVVFLPLCRKSSH